MSIRLNDFNLTPIEVGLFFCIYGVMDAIVSLTITIFTNRFDNKMLIVVSLFLCGTSNIFVGPSPFLPNSFYLMCLGQLLNGMFANFYCITSFSVLITDACDRFPKRKNEVTDISSGIFTFVTALGQSIGPIYGSNLTSLIGFRWCADTIAYILVAYSLIFLLIWKKF